jgi:hypothetical protein
MTSPRDGLVVLGPDLALLVYVNLRAGPVASVDFFSLPNNLIESFATAVQSVRVIVLSKLVLDTVDCEPPLRNSVAIAADQGAEVRCAADIAVERVIAEHHIAGLSTLIGHLQ